MDGLIALVYARKLYDLAEGPQGPPGQDGEVTNAALEEKLEAYAKLDGTYESMTVGNAEQLVSNVRVNDKTPYLFRTSGGSVDIGDREYVNGIIGGSVAWNQLVNSTSGSTGTSNGITFTNNGDGSWSISGTATADAFRSFVATSVIQGHKYLVKATPNSGSVSTYYSYIVSTGTIEQKYDFGNGCIANATGSGNVNFVIYVKNGTEISNAVIFTPQIFDLTQMFGSTIADYIYSLETANAGAGVAWFKKLFNKPYYAYNAGELKSVSGLVSHDMVGFNAFDKSKASVGDIATDGTVRPSITGYKVSDYIPVVSGATYYFKDVRNLGDGYSFAIYDANKSFVKATGIFASGGNTHASGLYTIPAGIAFIRAVTPVAKLDDCCINLSWDGSRDGEYEPYELHSYPLDSSVVLRGIPKLDANNELYYDGDTYESDGTVTRKYGIVNSSDLTVEEYSAPRWRLKLPSDAPLHYPTEATVAGNIVCNYPFTIIRKSAQSNDSKYQLSYSDSNATNAFILTIDPNSITTLAQAQTWVSNNPFVIVYELATPTTEEADPYNGTQIVNDFGTEEYVLDNSAFPVPVGHDTDYPLNLVAKLEMAPNSPEGNGDYIVRQTNGMNEYVPLVIEDALPTIPSTAGSYKLIVTVAEGSDPVLSWEAE